MKPVEILRRLVADFRAAVEFERGVARACVYPRETFRDDFTAEFVRSLVLCSGDWRAAVRDLRRGGHPVERVERLREWCERAAVRPVRGLLGWKGGGK